MEKRIAISESTRDHPTTWLGIKDFVLKISSYRVEKFQFCKLLYLRFEQIVKKVVSRELKYVDQAHLKVKTATPGSTVTAPHYWVGNFTFVNLSFLKIY